MEVPHQHSPSTIHVTVALFLNLSIPCPIFCAFVCSSWGRQWPQGRNSRVRVIGSDVEIRSIVGLGSAAIKVCVKLHVAGEPVGNRPGPCFFGTHVVASMPLNSERD
jgi:hypothetical protein